MQYLLAQASDALSVSSILRPYSGIFLLAFFVSFIMTPLMRKIAIRYGVVDEPDLKRKTHTDVIAYLGGVSIFVGWLAGILACYFIVPHGIDTIGGNASTVPFPWLIILGAAAITVTGVVDDIYAISPRVKIGGQLMAGAALASLTQQYGGQNVMLGQKLVIDSSELITNFLIGEAWRPLDQVSYWLGTGVIAIFVVGACNAMNLVDGLDGLAAGICTIAMVGFLWISVYIPLNTNESSSMVDSVRIVMCLASMGAVLGFLPFNFNPAKIFMGDAGSLLLGYLCITNIFMFSQSNQNPTDLNPTGPYYVIAAMVVFALPIIDTVVAIIRRKLAGMSISAPDSNHIHHKLLRRFMVMGLEKPTAIKASVLCMYVLGFVFMVVGCGMIYIGSIRVGLAVFACLFFVIGAMIYKSETILIEEKEIESGS